MLSKIDELENYAKRLVDDRISFRVRTIHPIVDLKEDLQYYMRVNSGPQLKLRDNQNADIYKTIQMVKQQATSIYGKLESDYNLTLADLAETSKYVSTEDAISEGIPIEAFELESPDHELKVSVLQEFIIIDFKYKQKLEQVSWSF